MTAGAGCSKVSNCCHACCLALLSSRLKHLSQGARLPAARDPEATQAKPEPHRGFRTYSDHLPRPSSAAGAAASANMERQAVAGSATLTSRAARMPTQIISWLMEPRVPRAWVGEICKEGGKGEGQGQEGQCGWGGLRTRYYTLSHPPRPTPTSPHL